MPTETIAALAAAIADRPPSTAAIRVVAVDGGTGAGKSTVAAALAEALTSLGKTAYVLHTDDLLDGWGDLEPSGERLAEKVLRPLAAGEAAEFQPYDWHLGRFAETTHRVPAVDVLILEGVGSARRANRPYLAYVLFVDAPAELRFERVLTRDGAAVAEPLKAWMAAEATHFAAEGTREAADARMDGLARVRHDHGAENNAEPPRGQGALRSMPDSAKTPEPTSNGARRRVPLRGISTRAWEHPADRGALVALRELRGFDVVLKKLFGMFDERALRLRYLGSAIRADHRQYSRVHQIYADAAATLDLAELPELYITRNPDLGGMTIGMDKPFVVITSGSVNLYDEAELRFLLGHELGHAASGHAVYRTMLDLLVNLALSVSWVPIGAVALRAIIAALYEWSRKSELSADRAGLLAGQDPNASIRALAKLAGGGDLSDVDIAAFLAQAKEFESYGDIRDSVIKLMMLERSSHDFAVARAASLQHWVDEGEYARILQSHYPKRADDDKVSITEEVRAAARSYRDAFNRSPDPIASLVRRLRGRGDID